MEEYPTTGIGAAVPNMNSTRLLAGRGCYLADVKLPRMTHAVFVRSQHAHAWIRGLDTSAAAAMPGVVAVLTSADMQGISLQSASRRQGLKMTPQHILATDRVRFVGEAVAVVIAEDQYLAEDAAEQVVVDYEVLPAVTDASAPPPDGHVPLAEHLEGDVVIDESDSFGDVDGAFARAAHVAHIRLDVGRTTAAPMEARGCVASYDQAQDTLTVWCSTQGPHRMRNKLAGALGLDEHRINVVMHDVGGAFGQKIPIQPEEVVVCVASRSVGRPVKWVEDRREHLMAAPHARGTVADLTMAVDEDGRITALRAEITGDPGAYSFNSASALTEPFLAARRMPGCYRIDNYAYRIVARLTNKSPIAPYRGVGNVAAQTARELVLDEVARVAGIDRATIRRRNIIRGDELPYDIATGLTLDSGSHHEAFELALEMLDYEAFLAEQAEARRAGRFLGLGLSVFIEATGNGSELTRQLYGIPNPGHDSARVSFDESGKVSVSFGTTAQGQGIETTMCQIAADVLGLPLDDVTVALSDTRSTPVSVGGTRASRVAVAMGGAVGLAAEKLRDQVCTVAAVLGGHDPATMEMTDGVVQVKGDPSTAVPVADIVKRGLFAQELRSAGPDTPTFSATSFYDPGSAYGNGAIACVVEVEPITGAVRLRRIVAVDDCGTVINPAIVEGQLRGGITQGIGATLLERLHYDDQGQITTTTLMDFLMPTAPEMINVEIGHLSSPSPNTWRGIKGIGEAGTIGMPAAVTCAVADALSPWGAKITQLPLLPGVVSDLCAQQSPMTV